MERSEVIDKAIILFTENGIRSITMDYIANSLSISKRTLYQMFKDKDDLLYECLLQNGMKFKQKALEILNGANNIIEGMFTYAKFHQEIINKIKPSFFDDLEKYHGKVSNLLGENSSLRNGEISMTVLRTARNQGYFRKDFDIEIANEFIHCSGQFIYRNRHLAGKTNKDVFNSTLWPYLKGLCTDKGLKAFENFSEQQENL